jgi:hypothetical protein
MIAILNTMLNTKKLYRVTLAWERNDAEQGDYCTTVWAEDDEAAIRMVAEEMASENEDIYDDESEKQAAIEQWIIDAPLYGAAEVSAGVIDSIKKLIAGPIGVLDVAANEDFDQIASILLRYGVGVR